MNDEKIRGREGKTRRLYFSDPYRCDFTAAVLKKETVGERPAVVLDQTCFYPTSGGQPSDKGILGGTEVVEVIEDGDIILHVLEEDLPATRVEGRVDWPTRFDHMQQHTGQHILSQAFDELLRGGTLSFHLGDGLSTLEIGLREISDGDLARVEDRANAVVFENRDVKTSFIRGDDIAEVPFRRPPKKEGEIRVVEVDGFDTSACGGTHCRKTGEVGLIKVIGTEKIRGNLRFSFVCGARALADFRWKDRDIRQVAALFSTSERNCVTIVEKWMMDFKAMKKRDRKIEERLAFFDAQETIKRESGPVIHGVFHDRTPGEIRSLALNIIRNGPFVVIYGTRSETQGHLVIACEESLELDMRTLIPIVEDVIPVKGGGRPSMIELVTPEKDKLAAAVAAARSFVEKTLADN